MSVRKKHGGYQARFRLGGDDYSKTLPTREAAEDWEAQIRAQYISRLLADPSYDAHRVTVEEWGRRWLERYRGGKGSKNNWRNYRGDLRNYIAPLIGDVRLADVKPTHIDKVVNHAWQSQSKTKAQALVRTMKAMFNEAVEQDLIAKSPVKKRHMPPGQAAKKKATLVRSEAKRLLAELAKLDEQGHDLVLLLLVLGCRQGELFALFNEDVDLDARTVHFRHTVNGQELGELKTYAPRTVSIPQVAVPVFEKYLDRLHRFGDTTPVPTITGKITDHAERYRYRWVFQNSRGSFIHADNFRKRVWWPAWEAAELTKRVVPHDLRHTYVTWNLQQGEPLAKVAAWIGDDMQTVAKTYAHVLDGMAASESSRVMDDLWAA